MGETMKASIIIINYNDKKRVCRAIDSGINQTWKDKEIIVVDDGSDKETRELYNKYSGKIKLIQLERDDNEARTPSRARNAGIEKATGDYICFLDSDNYYDYKFIEECLKYPYDVMFCDWEIIGLEKRIINIYQIWNNQYNLLQNYLNFNNIDHQCLLIKRSILNDVGLYDERFPRSQDCDLIVRLILKTEKWKYIPKRLFFFEKHEQDQTKGIASIYGKTLWTLKNNINIAWMANIIARSPMAIIPIQKAMTDFMTDKKWEKNYKNSEFEQIYLQFSTILEKENSEVLQSAEKV